MGEIAVSFRRLCDGSPKHGGLLQIHRSVDTLLYAYDVPTYAEVNTSDEVSDDFMFTRTLREFEILVNSECFQRTSIGVVFLDYDKFCVSFSMETMSKVFRDVQQEMDANVAPSTISRCFSKSYKGQSTYYSLYHQDTHLFLQLIEAQMRETMIKGTFSI